MDNSLNKILDECIDCINGGDSLEECLARYPQYADQLQPLLKAMLQTTEAYSFAPSASAKRMARERFDAALKQSAQKREEKRPMFPWLVGWPKGWVTVAAVLVIALIGYFGVKPLMFPPTTITQPSPQGNFAFLISDEPNAINDFQSLEISISRFGLQSGGEEEEWIEFSPEIDVVDLTRLEGDKAQEIWRGDVPEGTYTKVFIYVSSINGILKETGKQIDVKLPSNKLQISKTFDVKSGTVTRFVYDVTVVAAGGPQGGIRYILKPQAGQSGTDQVFEKVKGKGKER